MPVHWYQAKATDFQHALLTVHSLYLSLTEDVGPCNPSARLLAKAEKDLYLACRAFEQATLRYQPGALIGIFLPSSGGTQDQAPPPAP